MDSSFAASTAGSTGTSLRPAAATNTSARRQRAPSGATCVRNVARTASVAGSGSSSPNRSEPVLTSSRITSGLPAVTRR